MTPTDPRRGPAGHAAGKNPLDQHHAQHGHSDHDGLYNEDVAHEYSDVNVRSLLVFCVGLIAIVGVVAAAMYGMFQVFENQARQNDPVMSPLAVPSGQEPPEPRLLLNEPKELQTVKSGERQVLEGYAWVDQAGGKVRIPIDEAKKRLLERGLPVRAGEPVDASLGTYGAARGEASGGRGISARPGATPPAAPAQPPAPAAKSGGH